MKINKLTETLLGILGIGLVFMSVVFGASLVHVQKQLNTMSEIIRQNDDDAREGIIESKMDISTLKEQMAQVQGGKLPLVKVGCTTETPVGDTDVISQISKSHLMMVITGVPEVENLWLTVKSADWLFTKISHDDLSNPGSIYTVNGLATDLLDGSTQVIGQYGYIILQGWSSPDSEFSDDELVFTETIIPQDMCK